MKVGQQGIPRPNGIMVTAAVSPVGHEYPVAEELSVTSPDAFQTAHQSVCLPSSVHVYNFTLC